MTAEEFYHNEWMPEHLDGNLTIHVEDAAKFAEAYHKHRLESVSDEDIEKHFNNKISSWGHKYTVSPIQYMTKGAKWLRNYLLTDK